MAIRIALQHRTTYRYERPVTLSPHVVRLRPAPHCRTPIVSYSLSVRPRDHFLNWQQDPQGNHVARLVFPKPTREFALEVDLVADLVAINPFDFFLEPLAERFPFDYEPWQAAELAPYRAAVPGGPLLDAFAAEIAAAHPGGGERPRTIDFLVAVNTAVHRRVRYVIRMEPGVQPPEETLALGSGSCRDSAWLLAAVGRRLGLATRFCSGYLVQLVPDVAPLEGPAGPASDFTDLHAWAEVYLPGAGWVGLDPTSGLFAAEGHIPLAATPDPASAAPVTGGVDPCRTEFAVEMRVERLAQSPRTTLPFSEEAWGRIDQLGKRVDAALVAGDVRLTSGGEPTYVSIDDFDSPQWNIAAVGPEKWRQAGILARRLLDGMAAGGLLIEEQGKWYPGEVLPRWALELVWRRDGAPIWRRRDLLAGEARERTVAERTGLSASFARRLAAELGLDPAAGMPAHEHPFGDPSISPTAADMHRIGPPVAHVLPLLRFRRPASRAGGVPAECRWRTSAWPVPDGRVFLMPGTSPAGLRLPMAGLPWPDERGLHEGTSIVRTALVVEIRDGRLHVFLPPLDAAEEHAAAGQAGDDWLALVSAIERVAEAEDAAVVLEGYPPPSDARLARLHVTPDPGVIEVNVPPTDTWDELVRLREDLDREARAARLGAEKFEIDGLHVGTGGGDHLVLGGATPADSPFLRRPDLLASMVSYWNNHPALSYLFAGRFIGPTSQAPRVDEARHESLYELEIAMQQLAAAGPQPAPWLVDRVFRHLLVDLTGNTHRTEFCIDKLYSPDTASGRRGLVELRGFEMAPHVRMGLVAQLVVRALVAWMWRTPYRGELVRWSTALHDRFMLPTFVMGDFHDVVADLREAGFAFEPAWFDVFREFRFPRLGELAHEGLRLELRGALEPWHVLGEQPVGPATSRLVDSSLQRVEVLVSGLVHPRYAVACNGRRVPLAPTGLPGQYVAGVRFRGWQPPECLHPTIPVHAPLVFDVVDLWSRRSVAGCTWHVAHPGGRNYDTRPVNALESESRRVSRFFASGHTPGPLEPPPEEINPAYPFTLDLRRRPGR